VEGMRFGLCLVCLAAPPVILFKKCKHLAACIICANSLVNHHVQEGILPAELAVDHKDPYIPCPRCLLYHKAASECSEINI
jgi:hypothetical protein